MNNSLKKQMIEMDKWWSSELKKIRTKLPNWMAKEDPPPDWNSYSEEEKLAVRRWVERRQADEVRIGLSGDWMPW